MTASSFWKTSILWIVITCSCASVTPDTGSLFSINEVRRIHPAIYETVRYWEQYRLRAPLPVDQTNIASGFVLEYGNSTFKDHRSVIGMDTGTTIRLFIDNKERRLSNDEIDKLRPFFAEVRDYKSGGGTINQYAKDGNVYLLTLISNRTVSKIPYYALDLDANVGAGDVSILRNVLSIERAL